METQSYVKTDNIRLQLFENVTSREPMRELSLAELQWMIQYDPMVVHNTAVTRQLLQQGDRQGADRMKRGCYSVMPGARVAGGRSVDNIVAFTGLAMCDIDAIADTDTRDRALALLHDDPHVAMCWITHKGMGLRVLFCGDRVPVDNDEYNRLWQVGNDHFERLTGLTVDRQVRGATHFSQVAHDPEVLLRPEAMPFAIPAAPPKSSTMGWVEHEADPLALAQSFVEQHGVWYAEGHHNEFVCRMAYQLNRLGVASFEASRMLVQGGFVDGNEKETEAVVNHVYKKYPGEHGLLAWMLAPRQKRGPGRPRKYPPQQPKASKDTDGSRPVAEEKVRLTRTELVIQYLTDHYHCRYNTVTGIVEMRAVGGGDYVEVDDIMLNTLTNSICLACSTNVTEQLVRRVLYSEVSEQYDPFAHYLQQLPPWDGTDHVGRLAARVETSSPRLFAFFLCRFLVKMVRTMLGLDVNQDMLILAGPQRIGKSTFVATLLPPELHDYFDTMDNIQFVDKDTRLKLSRYGLISIEEYSGTASGGKTAEAVKGLLRQTVINQRRAYGVVESRYRRHASFVATTNESHLLVDATGNETLLPFWVVRIVRTDDSPVDYPGLYAQLYHLATDPAYSDLVPPDIKAEYDDYRHQFDAVNCEQELVASHYRLPDEEDRLLGHVALLCASEITSFINLHNRTTLHPNKVGAALSQMGYPFRNRHNKRLYEVVPLDIDAINAQKQADAELVRHEALQRRQDNSNTQ